jgi:hypothetical protein
VERCAGLDWAKDAHRMCVLEGDGEPLLQRGFTHDERDLDGMCELLVESEARKAGVSVEGNEVDALSYPAIRYRLARHAPPILRTTAVALLFIQVSRTPKRVTADALERVSRPLGRSREPDVDAHVTGQHFGVW